MSSDPTYQRILLKISGEALAGSADFGLDMATLNYIAEEVCSVYNLGVQVAIVVGGGNFVRGDAFSLNGGIDRTVADQMGMLGTVMNALALQATLEKLEIPTRMQSAINISQIAESFIRRRAIRHLEKGRVVVFAAGTGNPYFTTDTAGALRALEIEADCFLKATKVDGIYDKDPLKYQDALKYERISYQKAIEKRLAVMDQTAFTMCEEHNLPIIVLDIYQKGSILAAVRGEKIGTLVGEK